MYANRAIMKRHVVEPLTLMQALLKPDSTKTLTETQSHAPFLLQQCSLCLLTKHDVRGLPSVHQSQHPTRECQHDVVLLLSADPRDPPEQLQQQHDEMAQPRQELGGLQTRGSACCATQS
jgi:hypothetical protein